MESFFLRKSVSIFDLFFVQTYIFQTHITLICNIMMTGHKLSTINKTKPNRTNKHRQKWFDFIHFLVQLVKQKNQNVFWKQKCTLFVKCFKNNFIIIIIIIIVYYVSIDHHHHHRFVVCFSFYKCWLIKTMETNKFSIVIIIWKTKQKEEEEKIIDVTWFDYYYYH